MACELGFIDKETLNAISRRSNEIGKMLNGLINSLNNKLEFAEL